MGDHLSARPRVYLCKWDANELLQSGPLRLRTVQQPQRGNDRIIIGTVIEFVIELAIELAIEFVIEFEVKLKDFKSMVQRAGEEINLMWMGLRRLVLCAGRIVTAALTMAVAFIFSFCFSLTCVSAPSYIYSPRWQAEKPMEAPGHHPQVPPCHP